MARRRRHPRGRVGARAAVAAGAVLLLVAGALTVLTVMGTGAATAQGSTGLLRLAHLSPSTPAVDMYATRAGAPGAAPALVAGGVSYGALSGYLTEPAGTYVLQARPAGAPAASPPLFDVSVAIPAGTAQTAAFVDTGPGSAPQAQLLDDETAPAAAGTGFLRVVQAAAGLGPMDVTVAGGPPVARDLFYGTATPYATVPARDQTLEVTTRLGNSTTVRVPVTSTSVSTLVVTRKPDGDLSAQVLPDAPSALPAAPGAPPAPAVPPRGEPGSSEDTTEAPLPGGRAPARAPDTAETPRPAAPTAPVPPRGGIGAGLGGLAVTTVGVGRFDPFGWFDGSDDGDDGDDGDDDAPAAPDAPRMAVAAATAPRTGGPHPTGLEIPGIGLDTEDPVDLRVDYRGELQVPTDFTRVGWYTGSAVPGDPGPAILVGHVDTRRGPAVFGALDRLRPGDPLEVPRSDGGTARFVVDSVEYHPKDTLPTERIYGPTTAPTLRLLTCGGRFDQRSLSYENNVVVFASQR